MSYVQIYHIENTIASLRSSKRKSAWTYATDLDSVVFFQGTSKVEKHIYTLDLDDQPLYTINNITVSGAEISGTTNVYGAMSIQEDDESGITGRLGINTDASDTDALIMTNYELDMGSESYNGIYNVIFKTSGSSSPADNDELVGFTNVMVLDQAGADHGDLTGSYNIVQLSDGTIGDISNERAMWASYNVSVVADNKTVYGRVYGDWSQVVTGPGSTVSDDVYGHFIQISCEGTASGTVYGLYIRNYTGMGRGLYIEEGSLPNIIQGSLIISGGSLSTTSLSGDTIETTSITASTGDIGTVNATTVTASTGDITTITSTTGNIGTVNATTVTASTGNIGTVNATTITASTGDITTVNATTGNIGTVNATTVTASTGDIGTVNATTVTASTGEITTLTSTTGNIGTVNATTVTASTGDIGTVNATTVTASTGDIGTVNATTVTASTGEITTITSTTGNIGTVNATTVTASTGDITTVNATTGNIGTVNATTVTASTGDITTLTSTTGNIGTVNATTVTASDVNIVGPLLVTSGTTVVSAGDEIYLKSTNNIRLETTGGTYINVSGDSDPRLDIYVGTHGLLTVEQTLGIITMGGDLTLFAGYNEAPGAIVIKTANGITVSGSDTTFVGDIILDSGASRTIRPAAASTGADVTLQGGQGTVDDGGNVIINGGAPTGEYENGRVIIGNANTSYFDVRSTVLISAGRELYSNNLKSYTGSSLLLYSNETTLGIEILTTGHVNFANGITISGSDPFDLRENQIISASDIYVVSNSKVGVSGGAYIDFDNTGGAGVGIDLNTDNNIKARSGITITSGSDSLANNSDLYLVNNGVIALKERAAAPGATSTAGKIWTQSDNMVYFQDGDGDTQALNNSTTERVKTMTYSTTIDGTDATNKYVDFAVPELTYSKIRGMYATYYDDSDSKVYAHFDESHAFATRCETTSTTNIRVTWPSVAGEAGADVVALTVVTAL